MAAIEIFVVIVLLAIFTMLAIQLGVDSSDSSNDPRRPPRPTGIS